ncbi:nitroreductase family protein [Aquibacillus rhizosphaerae]|uniref:Nitroreductase n=1 Tax=Aquibacillus rhizosphaerae TaxID=3051431 RepID=A0ABT7L1I5_9BACI|nr:nitroreductase [Aquibacillus sp. LR5S19]MDL4839047.1 nitroreductase [Aquibacillus sp. LR5S19]
MYFNKKYNIFLGVLVINIFEAIESRRTILEYRPDKVDRNILETLFNYAAWAPNHHMKQPWKIKVYEDEARGTFGEKVVDSYFRLGLIKTTETKKIEQLRKGYHKFFNSVPHHILFFMEKEDDGGYLDDENYAAVCAYVQNFQLSAWAKGIGTMWTSKPTLLDPTFIKDVGLSPEQHRLIAVLQVGYPKKIPNGRQRTEMSNYIEWINQEEIK